jgi:hypothetical protein
MLFILTNSSDETATYLCGHLAGQGRPYVRLDTDRLGRSTQVSFDDEGPRLRIGHVAMRPSDVSDIWYRRPTALRLPRGRGDKDSRVHARAELTEALQGFLAHVPFDRWMNHPSANAAGSHKLEQITRARAAGLRVPLTLVTQAADEARSFWDRCRGDVIAKPLSDGRIGEGPGERHIYTNVVSEAALRDLGDLPACPTFFQERIRKVLDVRITVVDRAWHAIGLRHPDTNDPRAVDIRRSNMEHVEYVQVETPSRIRRSLQDLLVHYRLRFAAIDMAICEEGDWVFFEINTNGQWAWLDMAAGAKIADSFVEAFSHEHEQGADARDAASPAAMQNLPHGR